ncbi:chorismate synthase [uncultured Actinomyces sp.]|uniref:chorismate synthase n=1 Tax=uncultured Actinomyces sp. TaxID=249061 RepID=UPI00262071C9|nr:chorismate synthase [uncultured Actinomyces sp.]
MIRWMSAGESHGEALVGIIDGVPKGVELSTQMLADELARRRQGHGRGARQRFEQDRVRILGGVRHGLTIGSPVAIEIANSEWPKWQVVMSPNPVDPKDLLIDAGTGDEREVARNRPLTRPRPGHADLAGMMKFGHEDARPVLERASARETATRVALGLVARQFLRQVAGIEIVSHVVAVGEETADAPAPLPQDAHRLDASAVRTLDEDAQMRFIAAIDQAKKSGDTIGGVAEVVAYGVPVGLGSYTQWDERLDASLAAALMSIQSAKSVEIGQGQVDQLGSTAHDEIVVEEGPRRLSNRAGGIEGGMSNGEPIVARVGFKPISTVPRARSTIDLATGTQAPALHQRSDASQIVPATVICESMVALTLANEIIKMFGTGSVERIRAAIADYNTAVSERLNP